MTDAEFADQLWMASHLDALRHKHVMEMTSALLSLLEIADEVDRFCRDAAEGGLSQQWQIGLRVLQKKLDGKLTSAGLVRIAVEPGTPVDPRLHRVVEVSAGGAPSGVIVRELRAGFRWGDQVLRPADVASVIQPVTPAPQSS